MSIPTVDMSTEHRTSSFANPESTNGSSLFAPTVREVIVIDRLRCRQAIDVFPVEAAGGVAVCSAMGAGISTNRTGHCWRANE